MAMKEDMSEGFRRMAPPMASRTIFYALLKSPSAIAIWVR